MSNEVKNLDDFLCPPDWEFIAFATRLREMGATQISITTREGVSTSVSFAAPPKLVALPVKAPSVAPPGVERVREHRDGDGWVVTNPEIDLSTREGRDAARAEVLEKLGIGAS